LRVVVVDGFTMYRTPGGFISGNFALSSSDNVHVIHISYS